jgi:hypothetical protein
VDFGISRIPPSNNKGSSGPLQGPEARGPSANMPKSRRLVSVAFPPIGQSGRRTPCGVPLPHHRAYGSVPGDSCRICSLLLNACRHYVRLIVPCGFCPLPSIQARLRGICPRRSEKRRELLRQVRPFVGAVPPTTTASADFCRPIPTSLNAGSTPVAGWQDDRSPRVRRLTSVPYTRRIYGRTVRVISGFGFCGPLARMRTPHMRFLFVRPALCLQLPSDPASRRRPCCSANGSHHQGP